MSFRWITRHGVWAVALILMGCATAPGGPSAMNSMGGDHDYPPSPNFSTNPGAQVADANGYDVFSGQGETRGLLVGPSLSQALPWIPPAPDVSKFKQTGSASWYGKQFAGRRTASGERYDMFAMTAAHRSLPMSSYVKVTNPANGRAVVVRINDRGPFHGHRIIDLSLAAATALDLQESGTGRVEIQGLSSSQAQAEAQSSTIAARK